MFLEIPNKLGNLERLNKALQRGTVTVNCYFLC